MAKQKPHLLRGTRLSSLQRTEKYASFLKTCAPCIWSFLIRHHFDGFLGLHPKRLEKVIS